MIVPNRLFTFYCNRNFSLLSGLFISLALPVSLFFSYLTSNFLKCTTIHVALKTSSHNVNHLIN